MSRARARRGSRSPSRRSRWEIWLPWLPALPAGAAVLLALPTFGFTYLWDDYDFLARVTPFRLASLLPDPGTVFYRPLSREVYFAALAPMGELGLIPGHLVNAALLASAVYLTFALTARLAGRRAGIYAGSVLAALGAAPLLVGWVSGAQDLFAAVLGLLALHLRARGATVGAIAVLGLAILSKEAALAFALPVAAFPWLLGEPPRRAWVGAAGVLALLIGWAAIHPGIRLLLERGPSGGSSHYVEVGAPGRPLFLARSALTLLNLPVPGASLAWPEGRALPAAAAGALLVLAAVGAGRLPRAGDRIPWWRTLVLAFVLTAVPIVLTTALVTRWSPYYAFLPAIGVAIAAGVGLARLHPYVATAAIVAYLAVGVWARGMVADPTVTTERSLEIASAALVRVREGFALVRPTMPRRAQLLISVPGTGAQSVAVHLLRYAAPRVWYRDPALEVRAPEQRLPWRGPEILVRVTHALEAIEIDPETFDVEFSGPRPDASDIDRPIRTYARALGATGEPDRAVSILLALERIDSPEVGAYDRRLAALVLHQAGRASEGAELLVGLTPYPPEIALLSIAKVMSERTGDPAALDAPAFFAFGAPASDPESYRYLLHRAIERNDPALAAHFAKRLLQLAPADLEGARALSRYGRTGPAERITAPAG